ncbi:MAG: TIGR02302 family protein [Phreatobacter sp.]
MSDGTNSERQKTSPGHDPALGHTIDRARLVILWERVWPRLVLFLGIFGGVLAVSWLGFWQVVPYWARFGGVVFVLGLLILAAWPLLTIRRPTDQDALRRIDRSTGGGHRPASALADELATRDDPFAKALWDEHRARVLAATGRLKTGIPMPRMANLDRYAIRSLALLLIVPAYFLAGDERMARLMTAFDWRAPPAPITYRVDAWVTPPTYTGRPPLILPTRRSTEPAVQRDAAPDIFKVPAGSIITLRVTGLANVDIRADGGVAPAPTPDAKGAVPTPPAGLAETRWLIAKDGQLTLRGTGAEPLDWRFEALIDQAPTIAFERDPQSDQRNQLLLSYKLEDDYGVTEAEARLQLAPSATALQRPGARPLAELPPIPLALPLARTRHGSGQTTRDFVNHPFAGLQVAVTLHAKDDAGNEGRSDTVVTVLPQRTFAKPVPRALVEQRRILALDANARPRVARALEALTTAPDVFGMETAVYLGLRTAYFRLQRASSDAQLTEVMDYLWDIAVRIEDGDVSEAERAVQAAAERLRQAIERGASDEEIRRLSQDLRQAMDRLMRELTEQALRNRQDGQNQQQAQRDPNTRTVRPQDLRDMLNRIENLARNGARDQAQRLMQELQQMLQGLQAGRQQQQQQGDGTEQGENALDQLSDMIRRQQQLRDQTFRRGQEQRRAQRGGQQQRPNQRGQQGQQGQQGQDGQNQPGQGEQPGDGTPGFSELGENQRQLRELLDQLRDQLGQQGDQGDSPGGREAEQGLGNAGRAMREAEGALGRGDGQGATDAQGRALRSLQQGAQGLAQQMQEGQGQQGQGNQQGQPGNRSGQAGSQEYDPLGRPTRGREANENSNVRIPNAGEGAAQRAQRVLEELRRRLSDPDRPQLEMDYIERLLRGLQIQ